MAQGPSRGVGQASTADGEGRATRRRILREALPAADHRASWRSGGAIAMLFLVAMGQSPGRSHAPWPRLVLWAWERPTDLRFLDPRTTGVAFLADTLELAGDRVVRRPRLQPLWVPPQTVLIAVVRIEPSGREPPTLSARQRRKTAAAIADVLNAVEVNKVQIDFDATVSQRPFYRGLIATVRAHSPPGKRLSITALASWCLHDDWIRTLPIDEAVPMLFRMGPEGKGIRDGLSRGLDFRSRLCRTSLGVATDEPLPVRPFGRRIYAFSPRAWSPAEVAPLLRRSLQ